MSVAGSDTERVLLDPFSMIAIETLSEVEGGIFVYPRSAGAS